MLSPHFDTVAPRRASMPTMEDLLVQLAARDAAIAQLEQRCAELAIVAKHAETEVDSMSPVVELATTYITATNAAVSGAAYLELRRAIADRLATK